MQSGNLNLFSDSELVYREKMLNFKKLREGPQRPMNVKFHVESVGFPIIENFQDEINEKKARNEIRQLLKGYKLVIACSKSFLGFNENYVKVKESFKSYDFEGAFDRYITANIRLEYENFDFEKIELINFK